jgi:hypothetical protein
MLVRNGQGRLDSIYIILSRAYSRDGIHVLCPARLRLSAALACGSPHVACPCKQMHSVSKYVCVNHDDVSTMSPCNRAFTCTVLARRKREGFGQGHSGGRDTATHYCAHTHTHMTQRAGTDLGTDSLCTSSPPFPAQGLPPFAI